MPTFVYDGWTRDDGYVAAAKPAEIGGESLYDSVSFSYRVATPAEVIVMQGEITAMLYNLSEDQSLRLKAERVAADFMSKRLVRWDIKFPDGKPLAVTTENVMRLNPTLFGHIYGILRNERVSDRKPGEDKTPISDEEQLKNSDGVSG